MTWHSAFVLEFENAILAVDPSVDALPYWDTTKTTPSSVFTETFFGSAPGSGESQSGRVIDGSFPNFPMEMNFDASFYKKGGADR